MIKLVVIKQIQQLVFRCDSAFDFVSCDIKMSPIPHTLNALNGSGKLRQLGQNSKSLKTHYYGSYVCHN